MQSEEFRAGLPAPLPEQPLATKPPDPEKSRLSLWIRCQANAEAIIQEAEMQYSTIGIFDLKGAKNFTWKPTMMIRVNSNAEKGNWSPTLVTIAQMLHASGALDLHVLIVTPEAEERLGTFTIEPGDPIVNIWKETLEKPILDALEYIDFLELGLFNWGASVDSATLAILIIVDDKKMFRCEEIRKNLLDICAGHGVRNVDVVIEEGRPFEGFDRDPGSKRGR